MRSSRRGEDVPLAVGAPVAELSFPDIGDGSAVSVSAFRGDRLLLHLFASW